MNCMRRYPPVECIGLPDPKDQRLFRLLKHGDDQLLPIRTITDDSQGSATLERKKPLPVIGAPRAFAGRVTAINTMNGATIEQTPQNAELLHFCKFSLYII